MDSQYLTIHQFASLRGVSIGSLHYYEKLGLLKPASTDPKTHYRYYLPEQLAVLDAIQLCVSLDIPLKHLKEYMHDNTFNLKGVLEEGTSVLEDRIHEMKQRLLVAQNAMQEMKENQNVVERQGVYERKLPERWYDTAEIEWLKDRRAGSADKLMELFARHQKDHTDALFPGGIYFTFGKEKKAVAMIRVMCPGRNRKSYMRLPAGTYSCMHIVMSEGFSLEKALAEYFPWHKDEAVLISSMVLEEMERDERIIEIEILKEEDR